MEYRLTISDSKENTIEYDFIGFDNWTDFDKIIKIAKQGIKPDEIHYRGVTDMHGYFIKDGIRVDIEYDSMIGNWLVYKKEKNNEEHLEKVTEWARLIFDSLMEDVKEK